MFARCYDKVDQEGNIIKIYAEKGYEEGQGVKA